MVMLYKSCMVFHKESKKIKFEFVWFFYDFLCILQNSKWPNTIQESLYTGVPRRFPVLTHMPSVCNKVPGKIKSFAMWPLAMAAVAPAKSRRGQPGKRWGRAASSPRARLLPCICIGQAPSVQALDDWLPTWRHEPVPRHAKDAPEAGSRETRMESVSPEPCRSHATH
jgi:hypothetical protein